MPELPEMETYKTLLSERIIGKPIMDITINREKSLNITGAKFKHYVLNKRITSIVRRGKYLVFQLDSGYCLLLHLMLGGWMYLGTEEDNPDRTKQVILSFLGINLYFIGLRLGFLHFLSKAEVEQELATLGPNPLDKNFLLDDFLVLIDSKRGRLKTTLPNQQVLSGIGNCYTDEICYVAKLSPKRKFDELTTEVKGDLFNAIKSVLTEAIREGGYMEHLLFKEDSLTGGFNEKCKVYDREGEKCYRCNSVIIKEMISKRKTFYCGECQK
jgi:formamidopyrimidine-DNA glycosylase